MTATLQRTWSHGSTTGYYTYRCRCEPCRQAGSEYQARYRRTHPRTRELVQRDPQILPGRLPIQPLDAILKSRGLTWFSLGGVSGGTIKGWRHYGIPVMSADFIACRLGHHPSEIWPDWSSA